VRITAEFQRGHLDGALSLAYTRLKTRVANCRKIGGFSSIAARANGPPWPLRSCAPRTLMPCISMEYAPNASALLRRRESLTKWH
jgi:hypothetical protein